MGVPKYQSIRDELQSEILSGAFKPGDQFYSERELIDRFGVSSITVIRAIRDLADMGYLIRRQGVGTFISRARKKKQVEFSDIEVFSSHSQDERVDVVRFERGSDPSEASALGLSEGEGYYVIERVRRIGSVPFMVSESHIPARYINEDADPGYYASIYARIREDFGIVLHDEASYETDSIVFPISEHVARLLECEVNTPCVLQEKVTSLPSGEVVEHVASHKRWDFFKIELSSVPV